MRLQPHRFLTKRINPSVMKTVNAIELLELVRLHGPVSRAQLALLSKLSKPTVSDQVDFLIAAGLVINVGTGSAGSRGGKRPTLVEMNARYGCVLSVEVGLERIRFGSSDLFGRMIRKSERELGPAKDDRALLKTIRQGLTDLMGCDEASEARLRVVSVAMPGIVDVREGVVLETNKVFGWTGLRLGPELKKTFGRHVHVDNDVNMAALAEMKSESKGPRSFVLIRASIGIGAAVVLGGELHHGANWAAGEIAHIVLNLPSPGASLDRGYLESVVGQDRIAARVRKSGRRRLSSSRSVFENWPDAAEPEIAAIIEDVAEHLGAAVANIASVLDPEAIILMGDVFPPLLSRIQAKAARILPWPVDVRLSKLGDDAPLQGAVAAGVSKAYQQISWMLQSGGSENEEFRAASGA
jgi:predicted NBD/HSP70 family sugar kinase